MLKGQTSERKSVGRDERVEALDLWIHQAYLVTVEEERVDLRGHRQQGAHGHHAHSGEVAFEERHARWLLVFLFLLRFLRLRIPLSSSVL